LLHTVPQLHIRKQWTLAADNLAFSQDGQVLAALVEDYSAVDSNRIHLRIWPAADLRQRGPTAMARDLWLPELAIGRVLALNGDGSRVAVATTMGYLCVLDTATGALVAHRLETPVRVNQLRYRPDKVTLVGGASDQTLCAWRPVGTNLARIGALRGHLAEVWGIASSSDGKYLASGDFTGVVKLWEASRLEHGFDATVTHKPAPGRNHNLQFLSDSRTLVASSRTNASFWDIETSQQIRVFPGVPWHAAVRVSPNGQWIALARTDGVVEILDLATSNRVATLVGHTNEVRRVLFLPDNRRALTAAVFQRSAEGEHFEQDSVVRLWEVMSGRLLMETNLAAKVAAIALAPEGETFAVELNGRILEIRRTEDFGLVYQSSVFYDERTQLFYSPNGRLLVFAGGGRSNEIGVFDLQTRQFRFHMRGHGLNLNGAAFSPDGRTLATSANDSTVRLWNVDTGQEMLKLTLPRGINQVAFSPDGRTLAVGLWWLEGARTEGEARFFRAPSLEEIAAIEAKETQPSSMK
jgi:WD40 repeat protein